MRDIVGCIVIIPDSLFRWKVIGETKSALQAVTYRKHLTAGEIILTVKPFLNLIAAANGTFRNHYIRHCSCVGSYLVDKINCLPSTTVANVRRNVRKQESFEK